MRTFNQTLTNALVDALQRRLLRLAAETSATARVRRCFECRGPFRPSSWAHCFCSRRCYSRFHRVPGQIRKLGRRGLWPTLKARAA